MVWTKHVFLVMVFPQLVYPEGENSHLFSKNYFCDADQMGIIATWIVGQTNERLSGARFVRDRGLRARDKIKPRELETRA